jgi:4-hydroxy-tetrahydrodipicolinate reductase
MRVALIGYGKMGHEIERHLAGRGHEVVLRATSDSPALLEELHACDMAIEFTEPSAAVGNLLLCFEAGCPVVAGTTGWYNRLPEVKSEAARLGGTVLYASNFSIGVNAVFHINRLLARVMERFSEYTPSIEEIHHLAKKDKPSGTAITLAEGLLDEWPRLTEWSLGPGERRDTLYIDSVREGEVPGTHHVRYTSSIDRITLTHEAYSRAGFALGSVLAAEWLKGKKGVYTIHDFLNF